MKISRHIPAVLLAGFSISLFCVQLQAQDKGQSSAQEKQRTGANTKATEGKGSTTGTQVTAPIIVLVPFAYGTDEKLANGCWARLYQDENFRGDLLSVVGPVDIPNSRVAGFEWGRRFDSVIVGPKATVTAYDNHDFRQKTATFKPGQKVPDLDEKMGFFQNIRSLKVACS
jgi:hypothetical protein